MLENFIYAKTKDLFIKELEAGNVADEAIVFIEDTKQIWNYGTYFDCSVASEIFNNYKDEVSNTYATKTSLDGKVDKVSGKQLSTEDFTTALKTRLEGINVYKHVFNDLSALPNSGDGWYSIINLGDTEAAIVHISSGQSDTQVAVSAGWGGNDKGALAVLNSTIDVNDNFAHIKAVRIRRHKANDNDANGYLMLEAKLNRTGYGSSYRQTVVSVFTSAGHNPIVINSNATNVLQLNSSTSETLLQEFELQDKTIMAKAINVETITATNLATVATSGSYNDLSNKPSIASTTTDGLMSASDKSLLNTTSQNLQTEITRAQKAEDDLKQQFSDLIGESPETLDTIHEIAAWITNDESGAAAMATQINENKSNLTKEVERAKAAEQTLSADIELLDNEFIKRTQEITYNELVDLRDNGNLITGAKYRIADYVTTTAQNSTISAEHQFDIIVEALSENVLNEVAFACLHEGDTYFKDSALEAWELKYCLDNDTSRFAWADAENGKGVIYYMKDEWNNECFYDFKNIMVTRCKIDGNFESTLEYTLVKNKSLEILQDMYNSGYINLLYSGNPNSTSDIYSFDSNSKTTCGLIKDDIKSFYTFSIIDSDGNIEDYSLTGNCTQNKLNNYNNINIPVILLITSNNTRVIAHNKFEGYGLSNIQLLSIDIDLAYNNFSDNGTQIYLVDSFYSKIARSNFLYSSNKVYYSIIIRSASIYIGSNIYNLIMSGSSYNAFGNGCYQIQLAETCNYNSFGNGSNCITLEFNCSANYFGNYSSEIHLFENTDHFGIYSDTACTIPKDYVKRLCVYVGKTKFYNTEEVNENNHIQNIEINCTGLSGKKELPIPTNTGYLTKVACNSKGEMKVYCEADLIQ